VQPQKFFHSPIYSRDQLLPLVFPIKCMALFLSINRGRFSVFHHLVRQQGVEIGQKAFLDIGSEKCLYPLLELARKFYRFQIMAG